MVAHPERLPQESSQADLRQRTYELLAMIREPSAEEREFLTTERGFVLLPIEAKTLARVVAEHKDHFLSGELGLINSLLYSDFHTYAPKAMEVAFNPNQLYIPNSFSKTQVTQLEMTEEWSQANLGKLPGAKALMLPATVVAQADIVYSKMKGEVLFGDWFARALDQTTSGSPAARVGRLHPNDRLDIHDWHAGHVHDRVGAPLAIVFIGNR